MFFLDGSLTKDLKALTGLVLMPKDDVNILQNLVEHLTNLKYLHLLNLGLYCNCDNAGLVSWAKDNRKSSGGPPFLHLCLHSRDFQLGQDIVENIRNSIYASRRTLCLVSLNYLGSNWCSLEMQLATYRLQVEHRDILILVFLEVIPSRLLSSHHRLARLVKTRTYLDWPRDPEMHEAFWDRLWCKLSSNKTN
ncbi:hypothetical protein G5714_010190 [Onychostoma macrolepis]|uniref:TIR domain-containing protein n=1 Tax=Onychostoma macrolepis TaxID=369639 RepID=A0A7J6CP83_9TELE|nr:hypothetical protein G5714_010190 [Onychostoma macrolepis]